MILDRQLIERPKCEVVNCNEKAMCFFHTKIVCGKHILELMKKEQEAQLTQHELWLEECQK